MGSGWASLMGNFNPAGTQSIGDTYNYWLRNQMGSNPLAYQYGAAQQPWTSLAYLTDPLQGGLDVGPEGGYMKAANPFLSFLNTTDPNVGRNVTGGDWRQRAIDVQTALQQPTTTPFNMTADPYGMGADLLRQRFSAGEQTDAGMAEARQRALAFAPIVSGTGQALRGEITNLLNNIYQGYQMERPEGADSFLNWAMRGGGAGSPGLWERFGLTPAGASGVTSNPTGAASGSASIG